MPRIRLAMVLVNFARSEPANEDVRSRSLSLVPCNSRPSLHLLDTLMGELRPSPVHHLEVASPVGDLKPKI